MKDDFAVGRDGGTCRVLPMSGRMNRLHSLRKAQRDNKV